MLSQAPEYVQYSRAAIKEMYRQVGDLVTDEYGIAVSGLIVRHLILPHELAGSEESLKWLARELSPSVTVGLMSQYHPTENARSVANLSRPITRKEYTAIVECAEELGLENGWIQELESRKQYLPDFSNRENPFE